MIDIAYVGFAGLNFRVVYEYLEGDWGEDVWCDAMEIYINNESMAKVNMIDYLNDEVIQSLELQCIYINKSPD
jgi:hypothetical protein